MKTEAAPAWSTEDLSDKNPHAAADKAKRVEAMFNAIAKSYDLNNRVHSLGQDQCWRRAAVKVAQVQAGDRVLDCACGTGDLSFAFANAGAQVTGLDFTAGMLEVARHKAQACAKEAWKQVTFIQGDAMDLPFGKTAPATSFDAVSIAFVRRRFRRS